MKKDSKTKTSRHDSSLSITLQSFGFKYGIPQNINLLLDVRFLPNPYYHPELRELTGNQRPAFDFVISAPESTAFLKQSCRLLTTTFDGFAKAGKTSIVVAIGCTGGMHRSVSVVNKLTCDLEELGYNITCTHRELPLQKQP